MLLINIVDDPYIQLMSEFKKHLNNSDEIKSSQKVACLYCLQAFDVDELDWLEDAFGKLLELKTYCPKCRVADRLIGDASGIQFSDSNLKKIRDKLFP